MPMSVGTRFTLAINAPQPRTVSSSPRMKTKMAIPRPILSVCQKRGDARKLRRMPHRNGKSAHCDRVKMGRNLLIHYASKDEVLHTILYRGIIFDFLKVWKRWESKVSR